MRPDTYQSRHRYPCFAHLLDDTCGKHVNKNSILVIFALGTLRCAEATSVHLSLINPLDIQKVSCGLKQI